MAKALASLQGFFVCVWGYDMRHKRVDVKNLYATEIEMLLELAEIIGASLNANASQEYTTGHSGTHKLELTFASWLEQNPDIKKRLQIINTRMKKLLVGESAEQDWGKLIVGGKIVPKSESQTSDVIIFADEKAVPEEKDELSTATMSLYQQYPGLISLMRERDSSYKTHRTILANVTKQIVTFLEKYHSEALYQGLFDLLEELVDHNVSWRANIANQLALMSQTQDTDAEEETFSQQSTGTAPLTDDEGEAEQKAVEACDTRDLLNKSKKKLLWLLKHSRQESFSSRFSTMEYIIDDRHNIAYPLLKAAVFTHRDFVNGEQKSDVPTRQKKYLCGLQPMGQYPHLLLEVNCQKRSEAETLQAKLTNYLQKKWQLSVMTIIKNLQYGKPIKFFRLCIAVTGFTESKVDRLVREFERRRERILSSIRNRGTESKSDSGQYRYADDSDSDHEAEEFKPPVIQRRNSDDNASEVGVFSSRKRKAPGQEEETGSPYAHQHKKTKVVAPTTVTTLGNNN